MRGRKHRLDTVLSIIPLLCIKKESPNEGTETESGGIDKPLSFLFIKKESPNEGTETAIFNVIYLLAVFR